MGRAIPSIRDDERELAGERRILRRKTAKEFARTTAAELHPVCIILFGSTAKGMDSLESDVDVIVVGGQIPQDRSARNRQVYRLRPRAGAPMDVFAYTEAEFERMLDNCHVTALDAMFEGKPLYGKRYFNRLRKRFDELAQAGWHRTNCTWTDRPRAG